MEVILLEKIENLGDLGDKVKVKAGYGRNYLIPTGKAAPATKENIAYFEERRSELERKAAELLAEAKQKEAQLTGMVISITAKAGEEGRLFGSVTNADIAEAVQQRGVTVEKKDIRMPEGPIRLLGEYEFAVHLHTDVDTTIKVLVEPE